jgi:tetratricopeptide (TPR) repeat protein
MTQPGRKVTIIVACLLGAAGIGAYALWPSRDKELHAAREALGRRDFAAATEHLDRHLASHPDDREARLLAAQTARRRNDPGQFLKHIEALRQGKGPERDRVVESQLFLVQQGDLTDANDLVQQAGAAPAKPESALILEAVIEGVLVKLQGHTGQAWDAPVGAGDARVVLGRRAADLWLALRDSTPDRVQGLTWSGRLRAAAGDYLGAVADFRAALALDDAHFEARYQLVITIVQSEPAEALVHLRKLQKAHPENVAVLTALGATYSTLGRFEDARAVLEALADKRPQDAPVLMELGFVELEANRPAQAEQWLRRAEEVTPTDPVVYLALSRCMTMHGKSAEAETFRRKAEELIAEAKVPRRKDSSP